MTNPILVTSARRRMRSLRTILIFTLYTAALLGLSWRVLSRFGAKTIELTAMRAGIDGYIMLVVMQFLLIVLVAPAMTSGAISGERERQTLDLLLVTGTGSLRIALGKLLESFLFLALLIVSSAPFLAVVLLGGGVSILDIAWSLLFLLTAAFAALSVGLFCSALFKRAATSAVAAYLVIFGIGVATLMPIAAGVSETFQKFADDPGLTASLTAAGALALMSKALLISPAIGLFSLLTAQTELMRTTFRGYVPYGGTWYALLEKLGFAHVAHINMAIMLTASLVLIALSALLVRPRAIRRRKK